MKRLVRICVCLCALPLWAAEDGNLARVDVATVGEVPAPLVEFVTQAIERTFWLKAERIDPVDPTGGTMGEQLEAMRGVASDAVARVLLSAAHPKDTNHHAIDPTNRVGVVNVALMKDKDDEKTKRRVERQVVRIVAFANGLKPCPNPRCATCDYRTMAQLDFIGSNLCPPCQLAFRKTAKENGVQLRARFDGDTTVLKPPAKNNQPGGGK